MTRRKVAIVLFVVGMEVGRRADVSFFDRAAENLDGATDALAGGNAAATADYSFFTELDAPVEPRELRKLEEAMLAVMYWRNIYELRGEAIPKTYPLQDIWEENQGMVPEIQMQFQRENTY